MRCIEDEEATMDALIVHIVIDQVTGTYKLGNSSFEELDVTLMASSPCPDSRHPCFPPNQTQDLPR